MNRKGIGSSQVAIAVAAMIILSASITPRSAVAKASSDAIIGTGKGAKHNAIIGTGADAIIGTGVAKASSDAIIGTGRPVLLLLGPVDSVNVRKSTIEVLGRTFQAPNSAQIDMAMKSGQQIAVGLFGTLSKKGVIEKATLKIATNDYVAGASKVVVSGRISRTDVSTGQVVIGNAVVDVSLVTMTAPLEVGSTVRVVGTQPNRGGSVLAERLAP